MLIVASPVAWAQEPTRTPSPKELWEAYPLDPGVAPPVPTASAEFDAAPTVTAAPAAASSEDDGGRGWLVVALLPFALGLFGAGVLLGRRRWRERAVATPAASPPEPKRFDWRTYPPPSRPAPPPPGSAPRPSSRFAPSASAADSPIAVADSPPDATDPRLDAWRAEVTWDEGFKVRVLAPGRVSPGTNGGGPEREPALVASLEDLQNALEAEGWTPAGSAEPWYGRRFVWQHTDPPPGQGGPR